LLKESNGLHFLLNRIFCSGDTWSDEEDDTVSALMAATSNYWGKPDELVSSFGTCHSIPCPHGPTLPASGDYSAFGMWSKPTFFSIRINIKNLNSYV